MQLKFMLLSGLMIVVIGCGKDDKERKSTNEPIGDFNATGKFHGRCGFEEEKYLNMGKGVAACVEMSTEDEAAYQDFKTKCNNNSVGWGYKFYESPCPAANRAPGYCMADFKVDQVTAGTATFSYPAEADITKGKADCVDNSDKGITGSVWHP